MKPTRELLLQSNVYPSTVDTCVRGGLLGDDAGKLTLLAAGMAHLEEVDDDDFVFP